MRTDEELFLAYCQRGNRKAMETLALRHVERVYRIHSRFLRHADDAEDATQNSFLQAIRAARTWRTDRPFGPWFYAIVFNQARQSLRQRKRRAVACPDEAIPSRDDSPSFEADETEALQEALSSLPRRYRQPIELRYWAGMSYRDLSSALGCPTGTVSSRLKRGLDLLRSSLAATGILLTIQEVQARLNLVPVPGPDASLLRSLVANLPAAPVAPARLATLAGSARLSLSGLALLAVVGTGAWVHWDPPSVGSHALKTATAVEVEPLPMASPVSVRHRAAPVALGLVMGGLQQAGGNQPPGPQAVVLRHPKQALAHRIGYPVRGHQAQGRVLGPDGRGLAGAKVRFAVSVLHGLRHGLDHSDIDSGTELRSLSERLEQAYLDGRIDARYTQPVFEVTDLGHTETGSDGHFALTLSCRALQPYIAAIASHPTFASDRVLFLLPDHPTAAVSVPTLTLQKTRQITGRVLDSEGQALAGAEIFLDLKTQAAKKDRIPPGLPVGRTDEQGEFALGRVGQGHRYWLRVIAAGHVTAKISIEASAEDSSGLSIRLKRGLEHRVQVIREDGQAIPGAMVYYGLGRGETRLGVGYTDSAGWADLVGIPEGVTFRVAARAYGYGWGQRFAKIGTDTEAIVLQEDPRVAARFLEAQTGEPIDKPITVYPYLQGGLAYPAQPLGHPVSIATRCDPIQSPVVPSAIPDSSGDLTFNIHGRWPKAFLILAPGYAPKIAPLARPSEGRPTVELTRGYELSGVVLGPTGQPLAGARIELATGEIVLTDSSARFHVTNISREVQGVTVCHRDYPVQSFALPPAESGRWNLELHVQAGGRVRGHLPVTIHQPILILANADTRWTLHANPQGEFQSPLLLPGTYQIVLGRRIGFDKPESLAHATLQVQAGQDFLWEPDFSHRAGLSVRIEDKDGQPLQGYHITPIDRTDGLSFQMTNPFIWSAFLKTDPEGRAELEAIQPGSRDFLIVRPDGNRYVTPRLPVQAGANELRFVWPRGTARVRGRYVAELDDFTPSGLLLSLVPGSAQAPHLWARKTLTTYHEGEFDFPNLFPGKFELMVYGYQDGQATIRKLHEGRLEAGEELDLEDVGAQEIR